MPSIPEDILEKLAETSVSEGTLEGVLAQGAISIAKFLAEKGSELPSELVAWLREKLRNDFDEKRGGVSPEPDLGKNLLEDSNLEDLKRLRDCIGNEPDILDAVRTSFEYKRYSDEGNDRRASDLKQDLHDWYEDKKGIHILHLVTTGALTNLTEWLKKQKEEQGLSEFEAADLFEEQLNKWSQKTIFHKREYPNEELKENIISRMYRDEPLFIVFAGGSILNSTGNAIREMYNKIERRGYTVESTFDIEGPGKDEGAWIFEKAN